MSHFLSFEEDSRVFVISGFHTGRAKVAAFFEAARASQELSVDSIWECDSNGKRRTWDPEREEENSGERKKWLVVAILKRKTNQRME